MNAMPSTCSGRKLLAGAVRLVIIVLLALLVGSALSLISARSRGGRTPAGFGRGMLQGALMPMALPTLALGRDVPIYAENNTGRTYKLGYTVGVNACGAIFFGFLFWRLNRLRMFYSRT